MKTLTVGNLKTNFSSVLETVKNGEDVIIEFGRNHKKIAVIVPYNSYFPKMRQKRKIGILKNKAAYKIKKNFKISDEELISL